MVGGGPPSAASSTPGRSSSSGPSCWAGSASSLSGLQLIFPFTFNFFNDTFGLLNWLGLGLPTDLTPMAEQQLATVWHGSMAVFLIAVMIAHIYIGTVGMEGAFEAMGSVRSTSTGRASTTTSGSRSWSARVRAPGGRRMRRPTRPWSGAATGSPWARSRSPP